MFFFRVAVIHTYAWSQLVQTALAKHDRTVKDLVLVKEERDKAVAEVGQMRSELLKIMQSMEPYL